MPETNEQDQPKEWTLMFFFASDNALAPTVISQLKAIKQAGYHPNANVITQFDPRAVDAPTHIFDVNLIDKLPRPDRPNVGFGGNDPYIRSLMEDKLWGDQKDRDGRPIKELFGGSLKSRLQIENYNPPPPPSKNGHGLPRAGRRTEQSPGPALSEFLKFCREKYPARHYALFILGHGLAVGSDIFLYDEHAGEHSLRLRELAAILYEFGNRVSDDGAKFDLISFHSCSVSSLEVAYELEGTANYMLAAQSPAFVGSWPYQQILTRIFNDLSRGCEVKPYETAKRVFDYCYHNSADYLLAGYSFALGLCDLSNVRRVVGEACEQLSRKLIVALDEPILRDLILLAHWKSQSYWQETYTDLYDFCFCLRGYCENFWAEAKEGAAKEWAQSLGDACQLVIDRLEPMDRTRAAEGLVVRSGFAGPAYQYSHGLSVYFPWSRPSSDNRLWFGEDGDGEYAQYRFEETGWRLFLEKYFDATRRDTRRTEEEKRRGLPARQGLTAEDQSYAQLQEDMAILVYNEEGQLSADSVLKISPIDGVGDECECLPLKNFPRHTRAERAAAKKSGKPSKDESFPLSQYFPWGKK